MSVARQENMFSAVCPKRVADMSHVKSSISTSILDLEHGRIICYLFTTVESQEVFVICIQEIRKLVGRTRE